MSKQVDDAVGAIERMCEPEVMSKADALEFLEEVVARLESSIEALRDEIESEK